MRPGICVQVDVTSTAWDLAGGRFGGMKVTGAHWRTPLMLTAQQIQVSPHCWASPVTTVVLSEPALNGSGPNQLSSLTRVQEGMR